MEQAEQQQTALTRVAAMTESALQIRLDTEPLLDKVELFLRGEKLNYEHNKDTGSTTVTKVKCGTPLANELGIQMILNWVTLIINPQTVQGNLKEEQINQLMIDLKLGLAFNFMTSYKEWGIDKNNRRFINRAIENCCRLYVSRTLNNEERISYAQSIRHIESNRLMDNRKVQTPPI